MIIWWGSKVRTKDVGSGMFYCPECETEQRYILKEDRKFFTLYSIPLMSTKFLGTYLECQECEGLYKPHIIENNPQAIPDEMVETAWDTIENYVHRWGGITFCVFFIGVVGYYMSCLVHKKVNDVKPATLVMINGTGRDKSIKLTYGSSDEVIDVASGHMVTMKLYEEGLATVSVGGQSETINIDDAKIANIVYIDEHEKLGCLREPVDKLPSLTS